MQPDVHQKNIGKQDGVGTGSRRLILIMRFIAWLTIAMLAAVVTNNVFNLSFDFPAIGRSSPADALFPIQVSLYLAALLAAVAWTISTPSDRLRSEAQTISDFNAYLIRGCFFAVLFTGIADAAIAALRVEELLGMMVSDDLASSLTRARFLGLYVHIPLIALAFITALFVRTLGFPWLALSIVIAELFIVVARFLFSYEQPWMGDLVRYWYAALFLFASANTLLENGHVRVDVLYAGLSDRRKGAINAIGTILLGMTTCWVTVIIGFGHRLAIINGPVMNFEISQAGLPGMFIKYQMAAFLGFFAVTMLIQFSSYLLAAFADFIDEPDPSKPTQKEDA